ncbi:uncharacterized protein LOC132251472 [Alligator mississippiensis]|uniref:uncharacterized protein LOC132251472 n=1 Tax=Alligator mississippiensis TaxID=8496 RepID=UPI002877F6AB|nr:uncharacterized protein LOC132251472 [Alligator mississippiensis]
MVLASKALQSLKEYCSQLQVMTDPSSQALLGAEARLRCHFDVGGLVALRSLRVTWSLWDEKIAEYDEGKSSVQAGATMEKTELEKGDASLVLPRVTVTDGGLYTCVVGYGAQQQQGSTSLRVLGEGRRGAPRASPVAVSTGGSRAPPGNDPGWCSDPHTQRRAFLSLLPAPPTISIPQRAALAGAITSLPCHVGGFYPEDVDMAWLRDGQVLNGSTRSSPKRNPDGTFSLTLTYTFTPDLHDAGSVFACRARHVALGQPLHEEFPLDVAGGASHRTGAVIGASLGLAVAAGAAAATAFYCWRRRKGGKPPYTISKVRGPEQCLLGQEVTLRCCMEGTFPEDTAVTWERVQGEDRTATEPHGDTADPERLPLLRALPPGWTATQERRATGLTASLTFTAAVQDDGARVRCCFHHGAKRIGEQRESREIRVRARPELSGIQVWPRWDPPDQVPFAVRLHGFYPRGIHRIAWSWDGDGAGREEPPDISPNPDGTFTATSVWRVPSRSLTGPGLRVRVCVQHGPADPPLETELRLGDAGLLRPPALSDILQVESVSVGNRVTLSCHIWGHFPGELRVTWLRRGKGQAPAVPLADFDDYEIQPGTAVQAPDRKSFWQETRLIFTLSVQRDQGAQYICRVQHVALEQHVEKSSTELQVTARPELSRIQVWPRWDPPDTVPFAVRLHGFYPRGIHRIAWSWDGDGAGREEPPDISPNPDGTFTATSVWRVPSRSLTGPGLRVRVCVQHGPADPPLERELRLGDAGLLRPPEGSSWTLGPLRSPFSGLLDPLARLSPFLGTSP